MFVIFRSVLFIFLIVSAVFALDGPSSSSYSTPLLAPASGDNYQWSIQPVGETAQLVTLKCRHCGSTDDVPLLAVLRDGLGSTSPADDRLSYVWLLSAGRFTVGQRIFSAIPFFYWRLGTAGASSSPGVPAPLINLSAPLHPVVAQTGRSLLQWAAFDPLTTAVRATSRSYQANQSDHERVHLEQAIGYLQRAPVTDREHGLSETEVNIAIARLELRKKMLGGLLDKNRAAEFGEHSRFADTRIRNRNFEALRQFAEKTGTYVEPLTLAADSDNFALLWLPFGARRPASGTPDRPIWKLLNLRDPWADPAIADWHGPTVRRAATSLEIPSESSASHLAPVSSPGSESTTLIPLAVYSLSYPGMPLLLIDFRDKSRVHRHEILQRTITEFTSGILGLSHFGNWYYYAAAFVYHTVWARQGTAANQADRLDSYAQFRMELALDHDLEPHFRAELLRRENSLNVNPLDSDPARSIATAQMQFARLQKATDGQDLLTTLDRNRRAELASFGGSARANAWQSSLHFLSLGVYTHRVSQEPGNLARLERDRRIAYQLDFLNTATANGTDPRVAYDSALIDNAVLELNRLLADVQSASVRQHAREVLARVHNLSSETEQTVRSTVPADSAIVSR